MIIFPITYVYMHVILLGGEYIYIPCFLRLASQLELTTVSRFSSCTIRATLLHPNCFMMARNPSAKPASGASS